jgi:hypothetical protein
MYLNGDRVGPKLVVGGFFYTDRPAGQYLVEVNRNWTGVTLCAVTCKASISLKPGETTFVRIIERSLGAELALEPEQTAMVTLANDGLIQQ